MKIKDLLKMVGGDTDFDIMIADAGPDGTKWGYTANNYDIQVADVGHSSKIVLIEKKE